MQVVCAKTRVLCAVLLVTSAGDARSEWKILVQIRRLCSLQSMIAPRTYHRRRSCCCLTLTVRQKTRVRGHKGAESLGRSEKPGVGVHALGFVKKADRSLQSPRHTGSTCFLTTRNEFSSDVMICALHSYLYDYVVRRMQEPIESVTVGGCAQNICLVMFSSFNISRPCR